jgi:ABC-2 type transport system ATP-binding protein
VGPIGSDVAVRCEGVTKVIVRRVILDGLELTVRRGEVFGLLGPNGAGKTTTIRVLLGLSRIDRGSASLLGEPVPAGARTLARVGSLVETPSFYPWLPGAENIRVLLRGQVARRDIEESLDRVGLREAARRKVRTYSHGMRQRLALALALCKRPELFILDEPANGLDPEGVRDFPAIIREVAAGGSTVLLSSHQLSEVERACDRVAVIRQGRTVAEGTVASLGGDERIVEVRLAKADEARARSLLGGLDVEASSDGALLVKGRSGREVLELLARGGVYPESVAERASTLEERYLKLAGDESSR